MKLLIDISIAGIVPVGNVEHARRDFEQEPKAFIEWLLEHEEYLTIEAATFEEYEDLTKA